MDDLENELLRRTTIRFPRLLKSDEIETKFFEYLEQSLGVSISSGLSVVLGTVDNQRVSKAKDT